MKKLSIQEILIPDLHDFQLTRFLTGDGNVEATFQLEGEVVRIRVSKAVLARFEGDLRTMYVDGIVQGTIEGDDVGGLALTEVERQAIRDALYGPTPRQQVVLKAIGIAGIDLLLMGERIEFSHEAIPYEEPEVTPEEQARIDSIHAMLTGVVAEHGVEGLKNPKIVSDANRKRARKPL